MGGISYRYAIANVLLINLRLYYYYYYYYLLSNYYNFITIAIVLSFIRYRINAIGVGRDEAN